MIKYSIGLDVSSEKINCCMTIMDQQQKTKVIASKVITNKLSGFKDLNNWIIKHYKDKSAPLVIILEATGVYYESCALYLFQKDYSVSVLLPNLAKKYLESKGYKSKNDSIDAKGLSEMGAERALRLWQPLGEYFYLLRSFTRQHQNLQEQKSSLKNQIHALEKCMYQNKSIIKQLQKIIDLINKQIKEIEKMIEKHINSNNDVAKKFDNICKIKGIGVLTLAVIVAECNGFELFENSKQLASYSGFDIVERQSGKNIGRTKISKKGNSRIRRAMFMAAFSAVKCKQKPFLELYERLILKHGIKMKAYVAVQRKLLTTIYALWKNEEAFIENYLPKNVQEKMELAVLV